MINVICVIYLNDILIFNEDSAKHRLHVQRIFKCFKNYKLYINLKKCEFDINEIDFLNFIIFTKKMRMNSKRIQMIKKWFKFRTYREMQIFLKFVNFYKRFIYRYFKITALLTNLLKNNENKKRKFFSNDQNQLNRRFVNSATFLCQFFFLLIMIFSRKFEWKLTFLILRSRIFLINKTRMKIDDRWRFNRAKWYSRNKIIKFMIKSF